MKTAKILLHADKSNEEETPIKTGAVKLLKSVLIIFMLMALMSSCFVRAPGDERHSNMHGDRHQHHEGNGHHEGNEHHK